MEASESLGFSFLKIRFWYVMSSSIHRIHIPRTLILVRLNAGKFKTRQATVLTLYEKEQFLTLI